MSDDKTSKTDKKILTTGQRQTLHVKKYKAMGFVQRKVWGHPDDFAEIKKLATELLNKRRTAAGE